MAATGKQLRARALLRAPLAVPVGAVHHDVRHRCQRLHVVYRGRHVEGATLSRKRRFDARLRPTALQRVEQTRLLPSDVSPRPEMHRELQIEARSQDVPAQVAPLVGFGHRPVQNADDVDELAPDVDVAVFGLDGVASDNAAFEQLVRGPAHDLPVLECTGLAFIGVAGQVARAIVFGHETPFEPGAGNPAPPRPLRPDSFTTAVTCSGDIEPRALSSAL